LFNKFNHPFGIVLLTGLLVGSAITSWAQSYKGSVQANFSLEDGASLPGVAVTLSADTFTRTFASDENGQVRFVGLTPGNYELRAIFAGFQPILRPNIQVDTGANVKFNFVMTPGLEETMVIIDESPVADSKKMGTGVTLNAEELTLLPQARDPWAVLDTIPGIQSDRINIGANESGQQSNFVSKGDDGTNTAWVIDGVEFSDHAAEGGSQTYLDFGTFDQIGVNTGGSDVSSGASGTTLNFVTKQGTNEHHGSMRLLFADQDFQSSNLPEGVRGNKVLETFEKGFEIGGPIIKDRFWYWGSFQQNTIDNQVVGGASDKTRLENLSFKLHGNITQSTRATVFYTNGDKQKEGRGAGNLRAPETTWNQEGPTPIYKFEVSQLIGQNTEIQLIYGRVDGGFSLSPQASPDTAQPVFDNVAQRWQNSYREIDFSRPSRQYELKGDTYIALGNTENEFNYGFKYKNAWSYSNENWGNEGTNLWVSDYSGLGTPSYFFAHRDSFQGTELDTTSLWVSDTMTLGNLTLEMGLRYNVSDSSNLPSSSVEANPLFPNAVPGLAYQGDSPQFEYETISPQIGATYTFGENNQYLVRGSYRKYYDEIAITEAANTNAAGRSWITGYAQDVDGDGQYDASELGFALDANGNVIPYAGNEASQDPYGPFNPVGIDPNDPSSATSLNTIDPNLEPPEVDEFILGGEWSITPGFSIAATYTQRQRSNTQWNLTQLGNGRLISSDDFQLSHTLTGTNPETGESYSVDYYTQTAESAALQRQYGGTQLTNRPDYTQNFQGLELTATKRLSNKWMLRGYVAWQDWTLDVGPRGILNPTPNATRSNVDGAQVAIGSGGSGDKGDVFPGTANWTSSLNGLYQLPWDLAISGVLIARQGYLAPIFNQTQGFVDGIGRAANINYSIGPLDSLRYDDLVNLNLKLSKVFSMGSTKVDLAVEVFNVFNEDTILQRTRSYGVHVNDGQQTQIFNEGGRIPAYRKVDEYMSPRLARFSATINF